MSSSELVEILQRLSGLEARMDTLERRFAIPASPPVAPPVAPPTVSGYTIPSPSPRTPLIAQVSPRSTPPPPPPPAPAMPAPVHQGEDWEYNIGAKLLPRLGAAAMIAALAYAVSLAFTRGWITPAMLFGGICMICAGFIGVGLIKRDEKEEFGQILTAIGSAGLYLNFAAGHVFQRLYEGETLVVLFMAWSLVNLGYSLWRSSKPFLAIGLAGGLLAAVMPLQEHRHATDALLHFAILVPACLIAIRNRWMMASIGIYLSGMSAGLPLMLEPHAGHWPAIVFGGTALVGLYAYGRCFKVTDWDPQAAFAPIAFLGSALLAYLSENRGIPGSWAVLGLAAAGGAMGFAVSNPVARGRILVGALASAVWIAPFGLPEVGAAFVLATLALALGLGSAYWRVKEGAFLSAVCIGLALWPYTDLVAVARVPFVTEAGVLILFIAALVAATAAAVRSWGNPEIFVLTAAVLIVAPFARLATITLGLPSFGSSVLLALTIGMLVYGCVLTLLTSKTQWPSAAILAWCILSADLLAYVTAAQQPLALSVETCLLVGMAGLVVALSFVSGWRAKLGDRDAVIATGTLLVGLLFDRLAFLVLRLPSIAYPTPVCLVLPNVAFAIVAALVARRWQLSGIAVVAALFWLGGAFSYLPILDAGLARGLEVGTLLALLASMATVVRVLAGFSNEGGILTGTGVVLGWILSSRLGFLVLGAPPLGFPSEVCLVLPSAAYAFACALVGFRWKLPTVSYVSVLPLLACVPGYLKCLDSGLARGWEVVTLLSMLASMLAVLGVLSTVDVDRGALVAAGVLAGWAIESRLGLLMLTAPGVGMKANPAVTVSWIILFVVLLAAGFIRNVIELRYAAFLVIAATCVKVVFLDLANTDTAIKVLILAIMGGAMLAGGYWTIRRHQALPSPDEALEGTLPPAAT